ncbi:MAG: hypothetical protein RI895_155 [Actinomycetota bacterium]|jgi:hypothetical protein
MGIFTTELQKIQIVVFDRIMRSSKNPDQARLLSDASKQIPKDRRVVIVDSDLAYGNARALAVDLHKILSESELLFLAYDQKGLAWAKSHGIPAAVFSTKSQTESAQLWDQLIRAKVSVYDSHNWWRTSDQLHQRSLLAGSHRIQLWHGATGPVGKVFGIERLNTAKTFWHFTAVATSSVGFDVLVNEPSQAEYRRTRSMISDKSIHDVEYRLVEALKSGPISQQEPIRILVAPTYSESSAGEAALIDWIAEVAKIAKTNGWKIDIALHPGAKPRVAKSVKRKTSCSPLVAGMETSNLHNYSAVVTDFSGIAHDCLLLKIPTVSVLLDLENYQELCPILVDDDQMAATYVVQSLSELGKQISQAVKSDPLSDARETYANSALAQIGAEPGVNTKNAVLAALDLNS